MLQPIRAFDAKVRGWDGFRQGVRLMDVNDGKETVTLQRRQVAVRGKRRAQAHLDCTTTGEVVGIGLVLYTGAVNLAARLMRSRYQSGRGLPESTTLARIRRQRSPSGIGLRPPSGALEMGAGRNAGVKLGRSAAPGSPPVMLRVR